MDKIKVLELFAGVGACSKAFERLGIPHEIVDAVEIDKYAIKSFNAIHGTNFEPQDVTQWDKDVEVDLIMHGSPCQDFSLAGKQAGGDENSGTRSSLMYETIRIVGKLKPKYVIWENVKNLISEQHIHNFNNYISRMRELGYKSYWQVLNSKDYGIPQNRERVFTISIREDLRQVFEFPAPVPLKLRLKDLLEDQVDEKYYLSEKMINYCLANSEKQAEAGNGFKFEPTDGGGTRSALTPDQTKECTTTLSLMGGVQQQATERNPEEDSRLNGRRLYRCTQPANPSRRGGNNYSESGRKQLLFHGNGGRLRWHKTEQFNVGGDNKQCLH